MLEPADSDSNTVFESNEATFSGGIEDDHTPSVLYALTEHYGRSLPLTAIGSCLSNADAMSLSAEGARYVSVN